VTLGFTQNRSATLANFGENLDRDLLSFTVAPDEAIWLTRQTGRWSFQVAVVRDCIVRWHATRLFGADTPKVWLFEDIGRPLLTRSDAREGIVDLVDERSRHVWVVNDQCGDYVHSLGVISRASGHLLISASAGNPVYKGGRLAAWNLNLSEDGATWRWSIDTVVRHVSVSQLSRRIAFDFDYTTLGVVGPQGPGSDGHFAQELWLGEPITAICELVPRSPSLVPPELRFSTAGDAGQRVLTWSGGGLLESATSVSGPWSIDQEAISPHLVAPTESNRFYRVALLEQ
jgi:hypothetical protein